ncbi:MAG: cyclopropane-fatty-acyl-phospholipid synthase family protein [Brevundimonas sp.]|uniref:SAM-dependent methyltransferase n=1 Tax=Brevundimonas sp. TaxID=1871086 RepID=UPI00271E8FFD|nr:cyclopropane-fatty-acyl-phospholipid synthase family protein [Brevundimonas sp.]MDO9588743.1 cyclopropane-fatty-acyl-phospholipid synthase family protein [Brevundimonas sp.]
MDQTLCPHDLVNNYDHIRRLFDGNALINAINRMAHWLNRNSRRGSRRNIHAHYDLGNAFYSAWLDPSMTYSSARFERPDQSLEEAQRTKYASLARLMDLQPGHSVLEIGCGWGGFAEFAAREVGASITAVTISREQHAYARRRLFEAGLADKADVHLIDYRDVEGRFDRVASIEMFEAVGREYWPVYFNKVHGVLKPGGRAGLQVITIRDELFDDYDARTDFIQKYVFPGGSLPSEARLAPVVSAAGLHWNGVNRFGRDYADTLSAWTHRFNAAWRDVQRHSPTFDERFRRLWLFYLAYCEAGFRSRRTDVIQLRLDRAS